MPQVVESIVNQHCEEAIFLANQRRHAVSSSTTTLKSLRRLDERLGAHIDGLVVAGEFGSDLCLAACVDLTYGCVFASAARALLGEDLREIDRLLRLGRALSFAKLAIEDAFAWVAPDRLRGLVRSLLSSPDCFHMLLGLAACTRHRVSAPIVQPDLAALNPEVVGDVLGASGVLGRLDMLPVCMRSLEQADSNGRLAAASSAVLLGNRGRALDYLFETEIPQACAWVRQLALQAVDSGGALHILQAIQSQSSGDRRAIDAVGFLGDPACTPWLLAQMSDPALARGAGRALSSFTGLDLEEAGLVLEQPPSGDDDTDEGQGGPAMPADTGLPWPDPSKVRIWWQQNGGRFQPGIRYFMGRPLNRDICLRVLKQGRQVHRIAASLYLTLLNPGAPLFEWRAPAWRQERLLAEMA